jgi:uncharacterized lipoprotein NlpE involved in copper resistance
MVAGKKSVIKRRHLGTREKPLLTMVAGKTSVIKRRYLGTREEPLLTMVEGKTSVIKRRYLGTRENDFIFGICRRPNTGWLECICLIYI